MGILYAVLAAIFTSLILLMSKVFVKKTSDPIVTSIIFQFLAGTFFIPLAILQTQNIDFSWRLIFMIGIACVLYALSGTWGFSANQYIDISLGSLITQLSLIVTFFGSLIVFNEQINLVKIVGICLILVGNVILFINPQKSNIEFKGVILRLFSAVATGIVILIDAANTRYLSIASYSMLVYIVPSLLMTGYFKVPYNRIKKTFFANSLGFISMSMMGTLGYYFLLKSFSYLDKIIAVPIYNTYTVIIVVLGIVMLKERSNISKKLFATALVFMGAVILGLA